MGDKWLHENLRRQEQIHESLYPYFLCEIDDLVLEIAVSDSRDSCRTEDSPKVYEVLAKEGLKTSLLSDAKEKGELLIAEGTIRVFKMLVDKYPFITLGYPKRGGLLI
jgi:hypothetical protein